MNELIAIMERVYQAHGAILSLSITPYLEYKRKSAVGRYVATLQVGYVTYETSWMRTGFVDDDPKAALLKAERYATENAVSHDDDEDE